MIKSCKRVLAFLTLSFVIPLAINRFANIFAKESRSFSPPRPRIAIVTFYTRDEYGKQLKQLTFGNFKAYALFHGYEAIDALEDPVMQEAFKDMQEKDGLIHHFFKAIALKHYLPRFDWIMWADGDSIFLNFSKKIDGSDGVIDDNYSVILSTGSPNSGRWPQVINAGHYLVKNCQFTFDYLDKVLEMSKNDCHKYLQHVPNGDATLNGHLKICNDDGSYWLDDQGVMQILLSWQPQDYKCHFKQTCFRDFNSEFPWYEPGDLVVHFPGRSLDFRTSVIQLFHKHANFADGSVPRDVGRIQPKFSHWQLRNMSKEFSQWNVPCSGIVADNLQRL